MDTDVSEERVTSVVREETQDGGSAFLGITGTAFGENLGDGVWRPGLRMVLRFLRERKMKSKALMVHRFPPNHCFTTHTASHASQQKLCHRCDEVVCNNYLKNKRRRESERVSRG